MSAIGTKQTWVSALHMSAFGGKADMMIALQNDRLTQSQHPIPCCTRRRIDWRGHESHSLGREFRKCQKTSQRPVGHRADDRSQAVKSRRQARARHARWRDRFLV